MLPIILQNLLGPGEEDQRVERIPLVKPGHCFLGAVLSGPRPAEGGGKSELRLGQADPVVG